HGAGSFGGGGGSGRQSRLHGRLRTPVRMDESLFSGMRLYRRHPHRRDQDQSQGLRLCGKDRGLNMQTWLAWTDWLSTWGVIRAAGLTAYLFMFVSVVLGAFSYGNAVSPGVRKWALPVHQWTGWFAFLFCLLHAAVLTID